MLRLIEELPRLINEGEGLLQRLESISGQSVFLNVVRLIVSTLEYDVREFFQDIDRSIKSLNLPQPLYDINRHYVKWVLSFRELARKSAWLKSYRYKEFNKLSREFGKEVSRSKPRVQLLVAHFEGQISTLRSLLHEPPKIRQPERKSQKNIGKGWSKQKSLFSLIYIFACIILDWLIFPFVGLYIFPIIGVEVAIILGLPKLIEWLQK